MHVRIYIYTLNYTGTVIWNSLSIDLKNASSTEAFKRLLTKEHETIEKSHLKGKQQQVKILISKRIHTFRPMEHFVYFRNRMHCGLWIGRTA